MRIVLIADAFPPLKTSAAVLLRDLVAGMDAAGHAVTVLLPDAGIPQPWHSSHLGNAHILRLRARATKDVSYARRAVAEYLLPGDMARNLDRSPSAGQYWDGIVWYSPSIFFGPLVEKLKVASQCPSYLILRDIFPEWAVDMGLLKKGLVYRYFKSVERFQYRQADTIGVQTPSNLAYFREHFPDLPGRVEVLNNWLSEAEPGACSIRIAETALAGRRIFGYTGNIGIAQGMDTLIDLAREYRDDASVGFVFVGRGTAVEQVKKRAAGYGLSNILFFDEIDPAEIPGFLAQCRAGLIALDPRHRNDNIPGKFLAYMQAGLPVLANINAGNDLEAMVREHRVGRVVTDNSLARLKHEADTLLAATGKDTALPERCRVLAREKFSTTAAVRQIVSALTRKVNPA